MKTILFRAALAAGLLALAASTEATLLVRGLRCEYRTNPAGMDVRQPRLSWELAGTKPDLGQRQRAYQVLAATSPEALARDRGDLWDSGRTVSDQTIQVGYSGAPLSSRMRVFRKVRAWDEAGEAPGWSAPARWTMGLLDPSDWTAKWIADSAPD